MIASTLIEWAWLAVLFGASGAALVAVACTDVPAHELTSTARNAHAARPLGAVTLTEIRLRLGAERRAAQRVPRRLIDDVWPAILDHSAPDQPLTVPHAHREMQRHRNCDRDTCARKRASYWVLVDAGRLVPDSGRAQ